MKKNIITTQWKIERFLYLDRNTPYKDAHPPALIYKFNMINTKRKQWGGTEGLEGLQLDSKIHIKK